MVLNLANNQMFTKKEAYMEPMSTFITENSLQMKHFFLEISSAPATMDSQTYCSESYGPNYYQNTQNADNVDIAVELAKIHDNFRVVITNEVADRLYLEVL